MARPFTLIAALIFAVMCLAHVVRLFTRFQVIVGTHSVPMWLSYVAIVITGALAIGLYRESR